ncbi:MAG TPA: glutamyl-tRNA reductase [Gammaproteobacteria bacterium]|nr:glutamyl-tRNA reductase [Gammaproteobacteria bacterium]
MSIFVIGINHKTAPVTLREKVYFETEKLALYLQDIIHRGAAHEAVLLSTCNRSELYCDANDISAVRSWFCAQNVNLIAELDSALYIYRDEEAVSHIMKVACGLDSMIIGEPQILGQMKAAYSESCTAGAVGALFHRLFQQVFQAAKEIRTTTAVGACPVSVVSSAVRFVREKSQDFANANVVLVGAGDTTELMMRYLKPYLLKPLTLVNRTLEKASSLIDEFGGSAYSLDRLPCVLARADIVFTATGSAVPIITKKMLHESMQARPYKPIMMVDVAVPRDIEPDAAEIENVQLYCIDDLKAIIEKNRQGREHAGDKAFEMIAARSMDFMQSLNSHDRVTHAIRTYRSQVEDICRIELTKARQLLLQGENPENVLDMFASAYTKKLLHSPSVQMRQAGVEGRFELLTYAKQLFSIPDPETELS